MIRATRWALVAALLIARPAFGFYEDSSDDLSLELRGLTRWNAMVAGPRDYTLPDGLESVSGSVRLIGEFGAGDWFRAEAHALQAFTGFTTPAIALVPEFEQTGAQSRWSGLTWIQHQSLFSTALLELDRANVQFTASPVDIKIGRQPVSLASTYFFTPNDFFAPFLAQQFFRIYKPGVDAARVDLEIGEFTSAAVIGVLGYASDALTPNETSLDIERSSLLGRASTSFSTFQVSLLGGRVSDRSVVGGGMQGELFEWLGIRAEAHVAFGVDQPCDRDPAPPACALGRPDVGPFLELSVGLEHRFQSSLYLQFEQFFHGAGADDPSDYLDPVSSLSRLSSVPYLGRHYSAFGAAYELTPLLQGNVLALVNWVDPSALFSLYLNYSLLDEAELAAFVSVPVGASLAGPLLEGTVPNPSAVESEFGLYPVQAMVELRLYF